jgi:hypothetical protein
LKKLEETIDAAAVIWKELDVSCTHKARGLFDGHSLEQHKRLNGIGDKGEDFVERRDTRLDCKTNDVPGTFKISKSAKGAKSSIPNAEIK